MTISAINLVSGVGNTRLRLVDVPANINNMTSEDKPEICISKTRELLSDAQLLLSDIEKLLASCTKICPSYQRLQRKIHQEGQASIEEDGDTLVIDDFRFENAASMVELRMLWTNPGAGGGHQYDK
ncbi:hypothetical protein JOB18_033611 [Solea senegalensis]|uniref:Uncharacterized protein n=1 Tax=Solea senegalensis TaxID=28829 RepID=A0AAV6PSY6_SOLSE|nr:hypothetical protein JOB18_033611 [Solea senegalensis]